MKMTFQPKKRQRAVEHGFRKRMSRSGMSMRAFFRIIRVARTIADLDGSEDICPGHIIEAAGYRFLDKQNLGG